MIVNPGVFQALVINRFGKMENKHKLYIEKKKVTLEHSVKLLCTETDNQQNFDKAGFYLNAIGILRNTLVFLTKKH